MPAKTRKATTGKPQRVKGVTKTEIQKLEKSEDPIPIIVNWLKVRNLHDDDTVAIAHSIGQFATPTQMNAFVRKVVKSIRKCKSQQACRKNIRKAFWNKAAQYHLSAKGALTLTDIGTSLFVDMDEKKQLKMLSDASKTETRKKFETAKRVYKTMLEKPIEKDEPTILSQEDIDAADALLALSPTILSQEDRNAADALLALSRSG